MDAKATLIYIIAVVVAVIECQFTTPCLDECECNENRNQIFCYASVLTSNLTTVAKVFDKLSFESSNRTFSSLYFQQIRVAA